jgi:hypothetical protein
VYNPICEVYEKAGVKVSCHAELVSASHSFLDVPASRKIKTLWDHEIS